MGVIPHDRTASWSEMYHPKIMQKLNFKNLGKAVEGGIYLSFYVHYI